MGERVIGESMVIWQVNWHPGDLNHKLFAVARDKNSESRTLKDDRIVSLDRAIHRKGGEGYYFYLELIK